MKTERAQAIRNKRLLEHNVEIMFNMVLGLFEKIETFEIKLSRELEGTKMLINEGCTEMDFDEEVMKGLASRFNDEDGYRGEYNPGNPSINQPPSVRIEMILE